MAPLTPHWHQPSHPAIQEVRVAADGAHAFTTKSLARVALPPFALFAPMASPPCTPAAAPTYATVQVGRDQHINLNSDLLYINHSCEPSLIFDTSSRTIWVGPRGLQPGDELTFFYPSTEWDMAQPFACACRTPTCRGRISGARHMPREQLAGLWLNRHIWDLLAEQDAAQDAAQQKQQQQQQQTTTRPENGTSSVSSATTGPGLDGALAHHMVASVSAAEAAYKAARDALDAYRRTLPSTAPAATANGNGTKTVVLPTPSASVPAASTNGHGHGHGPANGSAATIASVAGATRRGPTSRELSGEMGGDTART